MTEEVRARNGYAASKDPEFGTPWLLRFKNSQSTKIADFHYHDDCEFVARALNDYLAPQQRESWSALRYLLQEANEERDKLAAENARLRAAFYELAGGRSGMKSLLERFWNISAWWLETAPRQERIVPAHIVALQEAIYREGGE